jgi:hypothetical protein
VNLRLSVRSIQTAYILGENLADFVVVGVIRPKKPLNLGSSLNSETCLDGPISNTGMFS